MDGLPEERRVEIEKRAQELITEEMTRRELRLARQKTQSHVAKELGINQENVSRIEKRADLLISTLGELRRSYGRQAAPRGGVPRPSARRYHRNRSLGRRRSPHRVVS